MRYISQNFPDAKSDPALFLTESGERITYKAMWHNVHVIVAAARKAGLEMPPKLRRSRVMPIVWNLNQYTEIKKGQRGTRQKS